MKHVKDKLKSSSGASTVIALIFFVVAMMVGTVCVTAAATNAGRASHALKDQQEYYAVESALKMITSGLEGGTVEIRIPKEITDEKGKEIDIPDNSVILGFFKTDLKDYFNGSGAAGSGGSGTTPAPPDSVKTVEITEMEETAEGAVLHDIPKVCAKITLSFGRSGEGTGGALIEEPVDPLTLIIELYAGEKNAAKESEKSNRVTVKFAPQTKEYIKYNYKDNDVSGYYETLSVTWYLQSVERGTAASDTNGGSGT